ncbi:uncharacterized protein LOC143264081 [Megachile rotundata]|uniref:uncharacterized protein LOC143264081 n=1 Tax=Megachile rotundata TaxID=143995 RepID=UPI003FD6524D
MSEYDYEIKYKAGSLNANTDALSRNPVQTKVLPVNSKRPRSTTTSTDTKREIKKKKEWHQYKTRPRDSATSSSREVKKKKEYHQYKTRPRDSATSSSREIKRRKEWHQYETRPRESTTSSREVKRKKEFHQYPTRPLEDINADQLPNKRRRRIKQEETSDESNYYDTDDSDDEISSQKGNEDFKMEVQAEIHPPPSEFKVKTPPPLILRKNDPIVIGDEIEEIDEDTIIPKHLFKDPPKINADSSSSESQKEETPPPYKPEILNKSGPVTPIKIKKEGGELTVSKARKPKITEEIVSSIAEVKDHLWTRKGPVAVFWNSQGSPLDPESELFIKRRKIRPAPRKEITQIKLKKQWLFGITVTSKRELPQILRKLALLLKKYKISDLSLPNDKYLRKLIYIIFADIPIRITICTGDIKTPSFEERIPIIQENHTTPTGGHKGIRKTYHRVRDNYYWKNMKKDIADFIKTCIDCQRNKLVRVKNKEPMVITDTPLDAFDKVSLDILGPLPLTSKGHSYILTIQDNLTKYSVAAPIVSITAEDVARAFTEHFICKFGCPKAILTDQGTCFMSSLMKKLAKIFHIQTYRTSSFHPQSNGSLERSHQILIEYLKHFLTQEKQWDDWLPQAMFSYNTSIHEGTKFTPHELVYGRKARQPSNFPIEEAMCTYPDYVDNLITKLHNFRTTARNNLKLSKHRQKYYYDKKIRPIQYETNEDVFLLNPPRKNKLEKEYSGPYKITRTIEPNNVELQVGGRNKRRIVHKDRIKRAHLPMRDRESIER